MLSSAHNAHVIAKVQARDYTNQTRYDRVRRELRPNRVIRPNPFKRFLNQLQKRDTTQKAAN